MTVNERYILDVAALTLEAEALGEAALVSDWDEARFCSVRIDDLAIVSSCSVPAPSDGARVLVDGALKHQTSVLLLEDVQAPTNEAQVDANL